VNQITKEIIDHLTEPHEYRGDFDAGYLRILNRTEIKPVAYGTVAEEGDLFLMALRDRFVEAVTEAADPDDAWSGIANNLGHGPDHDDLCDFIRHLCFSHTGYQLNDDNEVCRLFGGLRAWMVEEDCAELLGGESILTQMSICIDRICENFLWDLVEEAKDFAHGKASDDEIAVEAAAQEG
jgi:hypothetical protein